MFSDKSPGTWRSTGWLKERTEQNKALKGSGTEGKQVSEWVWKLQRCSQTSTGGHQVERLSVSQSLVLSVNLNSFSHSPPEPSCRPARVLPGPGPTG